MDRWAQQEIEKILRGVTGEERRQTVDDATRAWHTSSGNNSNAPTIVMKEPKLTTKVADVIMHNLVSEARSIRWRGIIAMIAGICQQTLCWGMIMTFGTILSFYTKHLMPDISEMKLCIIGGLPPFFVLAMSLLWGRLLDAGHHRKVNLAAMICLTSGLVGLAFTGGNGAYGDGRYWEILLASIPIGVGQSAYFLAAPHMAKTWYPDRRGLVMGITNSGAAIGGSAWPLIFTELTARYSYRAGIGTLAGVSGIFGLFIIAASTPAPEFKRHAVNQKSDMTNWVPTKAFRSQTFIIHTIAMCFIYLGILTVPFFIEYWAQRNNIGLSEDTIGGLGVSNKDGPLTVYLVVIMNACQLPGRLLGSTLCDYIKARKIHLISCLMAVIIVLVSWLTAKNYEAACIFAALFGLTLGMMVSLPINDVQEILGSHRTKLLGQYAGVVYTIASPFILGGAIVGGALVDNFHNRAAGIWTAATIGTGALLLFLSLLLEDDTWKFDDEVIRSDDDEEVSVDWNTSLPR